MSGLCGQIPVVGHISRSETADRFLWPGHGDFSRVRVETVGTGRCGPPLPNDEGFFLAALFRLWGCRQYNPALTHFRKSREYWWG